MNSMHSIPTLNCILSYSKKLRVLYVEDDNDIHIHTKQLLVNFFESVDSAFDGQEGLTKYIEYQKQYSCNYDCIITDITMPVMNGVDMCKEIFKIEPLQNIIILSGDIDYSEISKEHRVRAILTKPINYKKIIHHIFEVSKEMAQNK